MTKSLRSRRSIALIAAYVIALQAVLLPLAVAAGGPYFVGLCAASSSHASGAAGQDNSQNNNHDPGCPCAAGCGTQCCAQALMAGELDTVAPARAAGFSIAAPLHPVVAPRAQTRSPIIPRAPPAA